MQVGALQISIIAGVAVFLIVLGIAAAHYSKKQRKIKKDAVQDWLFQDFNSKLFQSLFKKRHPDEVAASMGMDVDRYYSDCALAQVRPDTARAVMLRLYAIFSLFICLALGLISSIFFLAVGLPLFFFLFQYESWTLKQKAEEKREEIVGDLPRFLDLLDTVIDTGMPIQSAIYKICDNFDCLLTRELSRALREMQMGLNGWDRALELVAAKYKVDSLDDFVREVTTGYRKGIRIGDVVHRQTVDNRQSRLLSVKEQASKTEQKIMLPIALLKILPLMAYLMVPAVVMITEGIG